MRQRVAYFVTCIVDTVFPQIGEAALEILERVGVQAEFPLAQTCCGQPAFNSGFTHEARMVAEHFLEVFAGYDAVVTPSGSCASMVRHYYPELFRGHSKRALAEQIAQRTFELSEFLVDVLGVTDLGTTLRAPTRAAIHDACHGYRGLGIARQPRALLRNVRNLTLVEMLGHDQCCGFGGLFAIKMSAISSAMLSDKLANIENTDCDIVITGDASCMMHINGGLSRNGSQRRVVHLAEVLAGHI
ncbi:MAG: (Fe-S)-binding protein [Anaerolineae bacterium]|nr:(Fe-S)-binding protein [Thermoflexales bacterium]MDW8053473.1 (Fe-S)-binding protein [Anaerolineae bacterium]